MKMFVRKSLLATEQIFSSARGSGMIGLGRMGANMVQRLRQGGHDCVVFGGHEEKDASKKGGD